MIKTFIISAVVLGLSATTLSAEVKAPSKKIDFAFVSETEHNIDAETTNTEFGVTAGKNGLTLSFLPNWDWEDKEIGTTPPAEDPNFYYPEDCAYIQGEMDELERMEYEYNLMEWEKQYN